MQIHSVKCTFIYKDQLNLIIVFDISIHQSGITTSSLGLIQLIGTQYMHFQLCSLNFLFPHVIIHSLLYFLINYIILKYEFNV